MVGIYKEKCTQIRAGMSQHCNAHLLYNSVQCELEVHLDQPDLARPAVVASAYH